MQSSKQKANIERMEETMSEYKLKTGKIGEKVVEAYQKIEDAVVSGYKRIEEGFVDTFLEKVEEDE